MRQDPVMGFLPNPGEPGSDRLPYGPSHSILQSYAITGSYDITGSPYVPASLRARLSRLGRLR